MTITQDFLEETDLSIGGIPMNPDEFDTALHDEIEDDEEYEGITIDMNSNKNLDDIDIEAIISLTARLSQLLEMEVEMLEDMRIAEMQSLQTEKNRLLDALEAHKRYIDSHPEKLRRLDAESCLELAQIVEIFQGIMKENHRRLLIAKEVNRKVMEAITDAVSESASTGAYTAHGITAKGKAEMAMSFNQTI